MTISTSYDFLISRLLQLSAAVLLILTVSSCGDGLSGKKYTSNSGSTAVEFKSGNKAYLTNMGQTAEVDYEIDDDKVKLKTPMGTMILTHEKDGTITGMPMTGPLNEQK